MSKCTSGFVLFIKAKNFILSPSSGESANQNLETNQNTKTLWATEFTLHNSKFQFTHNIEPYFDWGFE